MKTTPELLTIREVARYLRIHVMTAYKLAQQGKIPLQKVGSQWRVHRDVLRAWSRRNA